MKQLRSFLLLAFALIGAAGIAQAQTYDCRILFSINAAGTTNSAPFDNRSNGCDYWTMVYQADTVTTITLTVQSAPGASVAGTWVTFNGTVVTGINPNTSTVGAQTILSGFNSWIRVRAVITSAGTPLVNGVLYGYHSGYNNSTSAGCPGTAATPCAVDGPTPAGSAPTTAPVLVAGQDGAPGNIRTIKTDANGSPIPANASSAAADAISNTVLAPTGAAAGVLYPRVFNLVFNGTTWDRMVGNTTGTAPTSASSAAADAISNTQSTPTTVGNGVLYPRVFLLAYNGTTWDRVRGTTNGLQMQGPAANGAAPAGNPNEIAVLTSGATGGVLGIPTGCDQSALITLSAGTDAVIVSGVASQTVRICHLSFSISGTTAFDITIRQGTGSTCGTNTATMAGTYFSVLSMALDFGGLGPLKTSTTARDVCIHSSGSVTLGGVMTYALF